MRKGDRAFQGRTPLPRRAGARYRELRRAAVVRRGRWAARPSGRGRFTTERSSVTRAGGLMHRPGLAVTLLLGLAAAACTDPVRPEAAASLLARNPASQGIARVTPIGDP